MHCTQLPGASGLSSVGLSQGVAWGGTGWPCSPAGSESSSGRRHSGQARRRGHCGPAQLYPIVHDRPPPLKRQSEFVNSRVPVLDPHSSAESCSEQRGQGSLYGQGDQQHVHGPEDHIPGRSHRGELRSMEGIDEMGPGPFDRPRSGTGGTNKSGCLQVPTEQPDPPSCASHRRIGRCALSRSRRRGSIPTAATRQPSSFRPWNRRAGAVSRACSSDASRQIGSRMGRRATESCHTVAGDKTQRGLPAATQEGFDPDSASRDSGFRSEEDSGIRNRKSGIKPPNAYFTERSGGSFWFDVDAQGGIWPSHNSAAWYFSSPCDTNAGLWTVPDVRAILQ